MMIYDQANNMKLLRIYIQCGLPSQCIVIVLAIIPNMPAYCGHVKTMHVILIPTNLGVVQTTLHIDMIT
jgi:hypothetical protein